MQPSFSPSTPTMDSPIKIRSLNRPRDRFFNNSMIFYMKHDCYAEIVRNPARAVSTIDLKDIKKQIWNVFMRSCGQDDLQTKYYSSIIDLEKIAIQVNYLNLIHSADAIIGFAAGTYIDKNLFYLNSAMMLPNYQKFGLGSVMSALLCDVVVNDFINTYNGPYFVCRTSNQNAASSLLAALKDGMISTEKNTDHFMHNIFVKTAAFLHCNMDDYGIVRNVYPDGLPKGDKVHNSRVQTAFRNLKSTDACFIAGKLDKLFVKRLLKRSSIGDEALVH